MPVEFDYERLLALGTNHLGAFSATGLNSDGTKDIVYEVPLGAGEGARRWLQENRKTLKDAVVDHQEFDGTWRSVDIKSEQSTSDKRSVRLVQSFKKGWITSLVSGSTVDWSEARLVQSNETYPESVNGDASGGNNGYPQTEASNPQEYHLIRWEGVNPLQVNAVAQSLRDVSGTWSPTVRGEALGTGFYCLKVIDTIDRSPNNMDKSGTIDILLAKPRFNLLTWEAYGTPAQQVKYYLSDVPVQIAQALNNTYTKRTGASCRAGEPNENGLVSLEITDAPAEDTDDSNVMATSCEYFSTTTFYHNVSEPADVPENAMGITYRSRFDLIRQTGLYSGWIEKRERQTTHIAEYRIEDAHDHYITEEVWNGLYLVGGTLYNKQLTITGGAVTQDSSEAVTLPADGVISNGQKHNVSKRKNDDCTLDVTVRKTITSEATASYDVRDDQDRHESAVETVNKDKSDGVTLTAGTNELLQANVRYNRELDTIDVTQVTAESRDRDIRETEASAARTVVRIGHTATDTAPSDASQEDGKLKRTRYEDSPFKDRYQTTEEEITVVDQTGAEYEKSGARTISRAVHTQGDALSEPSQSEGYVIRAVNRPTEFGKNNTVYETIQAIDQTATDYQKTADQTVTITKHTQGTALTEPSRSEGTIVRRSNRPTEFDKNETVDEVITAVDQTRSEHEKSAARLITRTRHTQSDALAEPTQLDGYIYRTANRPTEFGKSQTVNEIIQAVDQSGARLEDRHDRSVSATIHTQGDALVSAVATAGTIVTKRSDPTEFGKYATVDETVTAKDQTGSETIVDASRTVSRSVHTQGDALSTPTQSDGVVQRVVNDPTEFGKNRTVSETVTAIDQTGSVDEDRHDQSTSATIHTQGSLLSAPTAAEGTIVRRRSNPTEYGLYGTTDEVITAKNQTGSEEVVNAARTVTRSINTQGTALSSPAQTDGYTKRIINDPTQFGKNRTVEEDVQAHDQTSSEYEATAARTVTRAKHTQNSSALSVPTQSDGYIKQNRNAPTEYGLYATEEITIEAVDQTGDEYTDSYFETVDTDTHTENTSQEADVPFSSGVVVRTSNAPTEFGRDRTIKITRTAKARRETYSFQNQYGTCYVIRGWNQPQGTYSTDVALYDGSTYSISGIPSINEYGLEDYTITFIRGQYDGLDTTFVSSNFDYDTRVEQNPVTDKNGLITNIITRSWDSIIATRITQTFGSAWDELTSWDDGAASGMTHNFGAGDVTMTAMDRSSPASIPITTMLNANGVKLYIVRALYTRAREGSDVFTDVTPT